MDAVIMAAGEGRRFSSVSSDIPKSLFPLTPQKDSLLARLLYQIIDLNPENIYIICGKQFSQMESWLQSFPFPSSNWTLVDARPDYQKGPLYSFLSLEQKLTNLKPFLLFPADTWFSPTIFLELEEFSRNLKNYSQPAVANFIFYSSVPNDERWDSYQVIPNPQLPDTLEQLNRVHFNDQNLDKQAYTSLQLPILYLTPRFLKDLLQIPLRKETKLMQIIHNRLHHPFEFQIFELPYVSPLFIDMDTPTDLKKIQKLGLS